ncbi:salicylic acid-binding 2-like [Olea europaea subsp. europaea]|uniref:Salicylic acid-binding 2-like n=1 Tax=Olea europaea subsp. europaea TaxID=158383 RepID=A0A8S0UXG7_OLEEU|nr:salicylic acid-binding 2-like [Olea europaea subsp. europaea]
METKKVYSLFSFLLIFLGFSVNLARSESHFVLVHTAGHGAWCWYKLVPLLKSTGHNVTAFDLAASGINPKHVLDVPFVSDYFRPLTEFMASIPRHEKVILVGHSYGGLAMSHAMERFPEKISVAVFVAALMPGPHTNFSIFFQETTRSEGDYLDTRVAYDNGPKNPPTSYTLGSKYMSEKLYQLSPIEDLTLATMLVRPLYAYTTQDFARELKLSGDKYGSVSRIFIMTDKDKIRQKNFQHWMIEHNRPNKVKFIKGSDNMVMMSKPKELLAQLLDIAKKYS